MKSSYRIFPLAMFAITALWPLSAHAYIGPAIAFVSYLLGPVAAIIAAIAMILFLPARALLRKRKKSRLAREGDTGSDSGPE